MPLFNQLFSKKNLLFRGIFPVCAHCTTEKHLAFSSLPPPFGCLLYTLAIFPLSLLFSRLCCPSSPSFFSPMKYVSVPQPSLWPFVDMDIPTTSSMSIFLTLRTPNPHSRGLVWPLPYKGEGSPPPPPGSICLVSPAHLSPPLLERCTHCWTMFNMLSTRTPKSFSVKLLPSWDAPINPGAWGYFSSASELCISPCWISWGSCQTIFSSLLRSLWTAAWPYDVPATPPVLCHQQTCWNHSWSLRPLTQVLNRAGPLGYCCHWLPTGLCGHHSQAWPFGQLWTHPMLCSSSPGIQFD